MDLQLIYIIGGFTISIIMGATMLTTSQKINLPYEVSEHGKGVIMGSAVGILEVGDEVTQPLSKLENKGFFPLIGSITTNDHQIVPSHQNIRLSKGEQLETTFSVYASNPGKYNSFIQVGLFYPFLPASIIYFLTQKSYWLALAIVSLIPGLPLIIYPFIDRKMRRSIFKTVRNKRRKLQNALPF